MSSCLQAGEKGKSDRCRIVADQSLRSITLSAAVDQRLISIKIYFVLLTTLSYALILAAVLTTALHSFIQNGGLIFAPSTW